jgi:hypothetical protein
MTLTGRNIGEGGEDEEDFHFRPYSSNRNLLCKEIAAQGNTAVATGKLKTSWKMELRSCEKRLAEERRIP